MIKAIGITWGDESVVDAPKKLIPFLFRSFCNRLIFKLKKIGGTKTGSQLATNKRRIEAEGFFRPEKDVSKIMRQSLDTLIKESTLKFNEWFKEYLSRKNEFEKLNNYLKEYSNENN